MLRFNPTTPITLYAKKSAYAPGQGNAIIWEQIESVIKPATEEEPAEKIGVFYCEWRGSFGERASSAQALGVNDSATVRICYNPDIYSKLRTVQVVIVKNADTTVIKNGVPDKNNPNAYELWGGVDNVAEENQFMEFKVRRYEGK